MMATSIETSVRSMRLYQDAGAESMSPKVKASSSFVLPDSSVLHYSLEGNLAPDSPVLLFVNDIYVNLQVWDPAIALLKESCPQYRFLRYDLRGYSVESIGDSEAITMSLLVSDLEYLFNRLSIAHIHSIVGLGFGANIALELLAKRRPIASTFVGIGFAISDSALTRRQQVVDDWPLRSSLARRFGMGILADKAVARWFTPDARRSAQWIRVREMIAAGSTEGMEKLSNAVIECAGHGTEQRGQRTLENLEVPALFLCGSSDESIPEEMETYPALMEKEKGLFILLDRTSRLACCEKPGEFVRLLGNWLHRFS
ncbi:alpha/beta-hydrolase [Mollisia scopiformis]|uniref:Alpha/beta-hydrolase n=1 Tax=Mollisia scopiformis TaxID=149040 RepID=A0A194X1F9_MOLSC|nr:alpha/beta-hydrolase [Mollisia scopiformis]KUJ13814.1 alpha/beta-hydrolase [Mollisia scopiformis]